ncbi:hypothetical protein AC579_3208 [Pseudocercospora musae]|uniref:Zinc/iron permease n=1 Tax=Pseudocercospora musae TaxID=113226 RepID=A0A139IRY3_9PEZI|nr:hypothetical protein AC579_3208 [Pseudocercospora musae]
MHSNTSDMGVSNDGRGWIMTGLSGIACIFGASFICVDIIVRHFPGKAAWRIQDSDAFLSISLSLSFGVMLFSALYSMLPSAKSSLVKGGYDAKTAAWILIACFIAGVAGIQILSRVMHRFIPHSVVDCEHKHDDEEAHKEIEQHHQPNAHHHHHHPRPQHPRRTSTQRQNSLRRATTPQAQQRTTSSRSSYFSNQSHSHHSTIESERRPERIERRTTLQSRIKEGVSKLTTGKDPSCACDGPCYGYSDICQSDCFKSLNGRGGFKAPKPTSGAQRPAATKSVTATESTPLLAEMVEEPLARPHTRAAAEGAANSNGEEPSDDSSATAVGSNNHVHKTHSHHSEDSHEMDEEDPDHHHHHHVPTNAFLNIGLQTSIAIALHKLPEGFITYATNHANPKLGVSVFLALFIHNITEGFAMALPLYLAINNRLKAMIISFALGGLSQPLGAGVAALWFKAAGKSGWEPSEAVYGGMFAVTAGILASVALQLFAESLDLTHSKHLCMIGAFAGMSILGISSALTA